MIKISCDERPFFHRVVDIRQLDSILNLIQVQ